MIKEFQKYLLYKERKASNTIKIYSICIEEFINWYYSTQSKETLRLDRETINAYKNHLMFIEGKKIQTINVNLSALGMLNRFFYHKNAPKNYILNKKYRNSN